MSMVQISRQITLCYTKFTFGLWTLFYTHRYTYICVLFVDYLIFSSLQFVDVETEGKADDILHQMRSFSGGRNTVPQIFFNAKHIGGNDDLQKLHEDGKLKDEVDIVMKTPVTMMMDNWYHPWY